MICLCDAPTLTELPTILFKKSLPVINNEIAKILANIVDFDISFQEDGRKARYPD